MQLPEPLRPWHRYLAWFNPEIASVVGDLLRRLQPLLGQAKARLESGAHEPEGVADLRRRGHYERLLSSEWLLAEAAPEEFLRRAASGEHLFLAAQQMAPKTRRRIVALFDSGPTQIGAARLVHVALCIVLARRAEQAGAQFVWGCLQAPVPLHELDSTSLQGLLASRSLSLVDASHVNAWQAELAATAAAEIWWIGNAGEPLLRASHRVTVRRQFDGALQVDIAAPQGLRSVQLTSPPAQVGAMLLQGNFLAAARHKAPTRTTTPGRYCLKQPPLLSRDGNRVAVAWLGENAASVFRLPDTRRHGGAAATTARWAQRTEMLAATFSASQLGGFVLTGSNLHGWLVKGFTQLPLPGREQFQAPPGLSRWLHTVVLNRDALPHRVACLDRQGNLGVWVRELESGRIVGPRFEHAAADVLVLTQADPQKLLYVHGRAPQLSLSLLQQSGTCQTLASLPVLVQPRSALLAGSMRLNHWIGTCALNLTPQGSDAPPSEQWELFHFGHNGTLAQSTCNVRPDYHVVGLVADAQQPDQFVLLALDKDRRSLRLCYPRNDEIFLSDAPITAVSTSDDGQRIALLTEKRELIVVNASDHEVWLRSTGGSQP